MAAVAALAVVTAAAGAGIGHQLWPATRSVVTAAQHGTPSPGSSGGSPAGGSVNPYSGRSPSGSGGTGGATGQLPFGLGGTGGGSAGSGSGSGGSSAADGIAAKVDPALVDINVTFDDDGDQGAGTGIVLTSSGEVLTNNHVIDGATSISVTDIGNGQTYSAKVVGYDLSHDVAVIQLAGASGLQTAKTGDSSQTAVGDSVVALGNAGGTGGTPDAASGSVTGLDQSITASDEVSSSSEQLAGLIQIDADIQPGDSGGSLVNSDGEVIGMDTAASEGYSFQSSDSEGYAIPIDQALSIAQQIESGHGTSVVHVGATAFIGVQISPSTGQSDGGGGYYGGGYGGSGEPATAGAAISGVVDGAPAQQAGLAAGDVITALDDQPVASASDLTGLLVGYHPGDSVQVGWTDTSGQSHTATLDLGTGAPA